MLALKAASTAAEVKSGTDILARTTTPTKKKTTTNTITTTATTTTTPTPTKSRDSEVKSIEKKSHNS